MKILLSLLFVLPILSEAQGLRAQDVSRAFQESGCFSQQRCRPPFSLQVVQGQQHQQLPAALVKVLAQIAHNQAQIWADTILEGDFWATGGTRIQSTKVLKQGQKVVGYHITYAEQAWYTGNCQFEQHQPSSLRSCQPGHIVESTFVTSSGDDYRVDENQFAKFIPAY